MRIPISWLHVQAYCEYQLKLRYVDRKEGERTQALVEGTAAHGRLEREFLKEAEPLEEPLGDYLDGLLRGEREPIVMREMAVRSERLGIYGKIDEIQLFPDVAVVIDDKPGTTAYRGGKHQVWGYILAFRDNYGWDGRMAAVLRSRDTQEEFWRKEFTAEDEHEATEAIARLHRLFAGEEEWLPTKMPNKCRACSFRGVCDRRVE